MHDIVQSIAHSHAYLCPSDDDSSSLPYAPSKPASPGSSSLPACSRVKGLAGEPTASDSPTPSFLTGGACPGSLLPGSPSVGPSAGTRPDAGFTLTIGMSFLRLTWKGGCDLSHRFQGPAKWTEPINSKPWQPAWGPADTHNSRPESAFAHCIVWPRAPYPHKRPHVFWPRNAHPASLWLRAWPSSAGAWSGRGRDRPRA